MRLSNTRVEWTKKELVRNILCSIFVLLLLFLWDNRDYLFQYKLHSSEYIQVQGRVDVSGSRRFNNKIVVQLPEGKKYIRLPKAWGDILIFWDYVPMVYSSVRKPELCWDGIVTTKRFTYLALAIILWNIRRVRI